ncbi:hypothetical protein, partial [Tenacibaculum maritimum]|uniref:hypothetical protein n=1 Tax=Tenacibaculum maritimum TaxID=107401 RepID=UPI003876ED3E
MLKIINHRVEDSVIKELLKSDYIDDFRDSIYYVEYKGKELYSFPFFNENNTINNHIIFHRGFRKVIYGKKDLSFWMKKSNVHFPKYLIISDRPENIVKYVSNKNHI